MNMIFPVVDMEGNIIYLTVEDALKFTKEASAVHVHTVDNEYRLMRSLEDLDNWLKDFTPLDKGNLVNMKKVTRLAKSNKLVCFGDDPEGKTAKVSRRNLSKVVKLLTDNRSH